MRVGSALFASPPPGRRVHRGGQPATWERRNPRLAASGAASSSRPQEGRPRTNPRAPRRLRGGEFIEACNSQSTVWAGSASPPPGRRVHRGNCGPGPIQETAALPRRLRGGEFIEARNTITTSATAPPPRRLRGGEFIEACCAAPRCCRTSASPPPGRRVHRGEGTIESACWWWRLAASGAASSSRHVPAAGDAPALFGLAASGAASSSRPLACLRCAAPLAPHR